MDASLPPSSSCDLAAMDSNDSKPAMPDSAVRLSMQTAQAACPKAHPSTTSQLPLAPIAIPPFLERLFEQERVRRRAAPTTLDAANATSSSAKQVLRSNATNAHGTSCEDSRVDVFASQSQPSRRAGIVSDPVSSTAGTAELAGFPMDGIEDSRASFSSTSSTPILAANHSLDDCSMSAARPGRALSHPPIQQQATYPSLFQTQLHHHHMHQRPSSFYDYASSTSSMTTDDTSTIASASEVGSLASRSTSPAARSASTFPAGNQHSTAYTYTSPATSPYLNHAHSVHLNGYGHGFLHLQPLKLPPPSLDLPKETESAAPERASLSSASCDGHSRSMAHAMPVQRRFDFHSHGSRSGTTSPLGPIATTSSSSTSQATTPGVLPGEMKFSTSPNSPRSFQQYSPLHPFHQQGFMSPNRSRALHTPLATLGPEPSKAGVQGLLTPPDNFAPVYSGIYRSSFPSSKNFEFLETLKLKTVLTLVQEEDYPRENREFFKAHKIRFIQIGIPGNKEPFVTIPDEKIRRALSVVLDKRNHPLLIHCNKGKHRTGCLVGCLRKMQCWSSTAIFEEYRRFSFPKSRAMDQLFIELFQPDWSCVELAHLPSWCEGEDGGLQGRGLATTPGVSALAGSPHSPAPAPPR